MTYAALLAAGAALTATAAFAQDSGLTEEDARGFVEPLAQQAEEAVASGDWKGIAHWISEHVAEDAPIALSGSVLASTGPALNFDAVMKGVDLAHYVEMTTGSQQTPFAGSIENYALATQVQSVWPIPGGGVAMSVAFYESGALAAPEGSDAETATGAFSSATECALRLGGTPDAMVIEMARCHVQSLL